MSGRRDRGPSVNITLSQRAPPAPPGETVTGGSYDGTTAAKGQPGRGQPPGAAAPTLSSAPGDDTFEVEARRALATERVDVSMVRLAAGSGHRGRP